MHEEALIHGTCIAIGAEGVLLVGKPGSGKSDLALRLIDQSGGGLSGIQKTAQLVAEVIDPVAQHTERVLAGVDGVLYARIRERYVTAGGELGKIAGATPFRTGPLLGD